MRTFVMRLDSATRCERIEHVASFVGEDSSGSFGIMAGHVRMITFLSFGLARFRRAGGETEYLALPGGLLYFVANELRISTRQYFRSRRYDEMAAILDRQLHEEEENLKAIKDSLRRLDESILRRLLTLRLSDER
jgi:F-type H+-transporting ATPase subunit epsilon